METLASSKDHTLEELVAIDEHVEELRNIEDSTKRINALAEYYRSLGKSVVEEPKGEKLAAINSHMTSYKRSLANARAVQSVTNES